MNADNLMTELSKKMESKFCKSCKWVRPTPWYDCAGWGNRYRFAKCANIKAQGASHDNDSMIDGETHITYCSVARLDWNCGKDSKYWEAK